jgi:tetratricopeptide (TPR) repeat protein
VSAKLEKDLPDQLRGSWLKAVAAIEVRNFGYAIELLQNLLKKEPRFLTGRQVLRRAAVARSKSEKKSFFRISTSSLAIMQAQREVKKDPGKTIELIEKILENDPYNLPANRLLKEAAVAAEYPEIAIFAMETLLENDSKSVEVLHELGRLYDQYEQPDRAVEIYSRILEILPNDLRAIKLGKEASACASMKEGGWIEAGSYRDLIRNKDVARSPDQRSGTQLSDELLDEQISETFAQHAIEPRNVDLARRLGRLHDQKNDLAGAIAWYQYSVDLTSESDPGLLRKVADLRIKQLERQIGEDERYLKEHGRNGPDFAKVLAKLEAARKQRTEILIIDARKRLDHNPTDLKLRYELGEQLANAGKYREALPELQRARQNPQARYKSMNLLGRCYHELGMLDLAARQLEEATGELIAMDELKKEIVYNLGLVYEKMGDAQKSIDAMKKVYQADYGYRDVAERVENSYGRSTDDP